LASLSPRIVVFLSGVRDARVVLKKAFHHSQGALIGAK
jgi:hypothetical protein